MIYCGRCGTENVEGDRFCVGCGATLRERSPTPPDAHPVGEDSDVTRPEPRTDATNLTPGSLLEAGRYRLDAVLGTGGMGTVYRATDLKLGQAVALKIIHGHLHEGTTGIERLRNEVRVARELQHPGIVRVYELGSDRGREFFTMELVEGPTLRELLEQRSEPLSLEEAKAVLLPLLDALTYAHEHTVHRDVKPENVLLAGGDLGQPRLADFGIAKAIEGETLTRTALALGTPEYVAPEQMRDAAHVDHRADLYSVGVMLYELVTGKRPVGLFRMPSQLRPELPDQLDQVVGELLQPEPGDRPASARAVAEQLNALGQVATEQEQLSSQSPVESEDATSGRPEPGRSEVGPPSSEDSQPSSRRHGGRWVLGVTLVGVLGLLLLFVREDPELQRGGADEPTLAPVEEVAIPPEPEPEVPAEPPSGLVVLSDVEGAVVTIDGRDFGTPGSERHELELGTHTVRVEREGYAPYEADVPVVAGEFRTVRAQLSPLRAGLVVRSNVSNDRVTIDGRSYGASGSRRHELDPGAYTVRVTKDGYKTYEERVELSPGEEGTVRAELESLAPPVPAVRSGMVHVPAGEFYYGCNESVDTECDDDEKPGKRITLAAFHIDKTEVTVSAYEACKRAGACTVPKSGGSCNWGKSDRERHPINCVDWNQAKAYCAWAGNRLPTEQEWEKAARGTDGRKYPWGNERASCARAVMDDGGGNGCGRGNTTWPVGSKPSGVSPYGALDMVGNVWEWTSSRGDSGGRVLRGGSWYAPPRRVRASYRRWYAPSRRLVRGGFRCAR